MSFGGVGAMCSAHVKRGNIDRSDFERALLTDTCPLDVPVIFSNDGFHENLRKAANSEGLRRIIAALVTGNVERYTVPYRYRIRLSNISSRQLSLAHPAAQHRACGFYSTYGHLLPYFCRHGDVSLRRPIKIGSTFFYLNRSAESKQYKGAAIDLLSHDETTRNPGSFFVYEKYDRFYKFFNSDEFVNLEKSFSRMRLTDVSKCFSSIYSHTLAWAVKDIQHGKESANAISFANDFDSLMQFSNYNETNGIPVGAEVSRLFAEIILQSVDASVLRKAAAAGKLHGEHFAMRRYVDDYIVFANEPSVLDFVQRMIVDALLTFNLHLNEAKTLTINRPLQTRRSQIISGASPGLVHFRDAVSVYDGVSRVSSPKAIYNPSSLVRKFLNDIKVACVNGEAGYEDVSPYIIGSLTSTLESMVGSHASVQFEIRKDGERYARAFDVLLTALYFFFTVHPTVTASFQVAKATVLSVRFFREKLPRASAHINERVRSLTQDVIVQLNESTAQMVECAPIEMLNIVLASAELPEEYQVNASEIKRQILESEINDYFSIVSILFYVRYSDRRFVAGLEAKLSNTVLSRGLPRRSSQDAHLLLDLITCPYLSTPFRSECLKSILASLEISDQLYSRALLAEMGSRPWFVNWQQIDLLNHLKKKELRAVY